MPPRAGFDHAAYISLHIRPHLLDVLESGDRVAYFADEDHAAAEAAKLPEDREEIAPPTRAKGDIVYLVRSLLVLKGGDQMADDVVRRLMEQAEAAAKAYNAAVEQRKNVKKAARALADSGLLSDEDLNRVNELFPKRDATPTGDVPATPATPAADAPADVPAAPATPAADAPAASPVPGRKK